MEREREVEWVEVRAKTISQRLEQHRKKRQKLQCASTHRTKKKTLDSLIVVIDQKKPKGSKLIKKLLIKISTRNSAIYCINPCTEAAYRFRSAVILDIILEELFFT